MAFRRVPVVLNVNGHDAKGKAADYKQIRCINQARRGMLALNLEWFGMGQLQGDGFRHGLGGLHLTRRRRLQARHAVDF